MKTFRAPDGVQWGVTVTNPGASNAIVVFQHPAGRAARLDRYAWYLAKGPEARNVTSRLDVVTVLEVLTERDLQRLFRTSFAMAEERAIYRAV